MPLHARELAGTTDYDLDEERAWVCEQRWTGVAGLVRFRTLVHNDVPGQAEISKRFTDDDGHAAFSVGTNGFVALYRGFNKFTQPWERAANQWDLAKSQVETVLPGGTYCNLASETRPVPTRSTDCVSGVTVVVAANGIIVSGVVDRGGVVALHKNHQVVPTPAPTAQTVTTPAPTAQTVTQ